MEINNERKPGYYWVKLNAEEDYVIAEYIGDDAWHIMWNENLFWDSDFEEINEEIITKQS
jgi:hypothetical protein